MRTPIRLAACLAVLTGLTACTGSTNPETATLFDNIRNLSSGEYDRQIAQLDAQSDAVIRQNRASEANIARLENTRAANSAEISNLRAQLAQVRAEAAAARSRVANDPAKLRQINALDSQINQVARDIDQGGDPTVLRNELQRIRNTVRAVAG